MVAEVRPLDGWAAAGPGHAAEAVGHARVDPHGAADARPAHRRRPDRRARIRARAGRRAARERNRLMEISEVRQRVLADHRPREARRGRAARADRRSVARVRGVSRTVAVPLFRQVADALKAEGYSFTVFTPGRQRAPDVGQGSRGLHRAHARHDRQSTGGARPHQPRARPARRRIGTAGRRGTRSRHHGRSGAEFLLEELEPFVER